MPTLTRTAATARRTPPVVRPADLPHVVLLTRADGREVVTRYADRATAARAAVAILALLGPAAECAAVFGAWQPTDGSAEPALCWGVAEDGTVEALHAV